MAVSPLGAAAFATGDSVTLLTDGNLVVVDVPGDQVASDGASEGFFVANTEGGVLYRVDPTGTIVWQEDVEGTIVGFAASPLGALVFVADEPLVGAELTAWDVDGALLHALEFPSAGPLRTSPTGRWFAANPGNGEQFVLSWTEPITSP